MAARQIVKPAITVLVVGLAVVASAMAGTMASTGLVVSYDGVPRFEEIPGTSLLYAGNASAQVLKAGDCFYAVDQGIWYTSAAPDGPWTVAGSRPDDVADIPPESPAYNLKYVYIYDFTSDAVPAGYRPGYPAAFPYRGAAIYGRGYTYRPWMPPAGYYPGPGPWGYGLYHDPWYGRGSSYRPPPDPGPRRGFRPPERTHIGAAPGVSVRPPGQAGGRDDSRTPARIRRSDGSRGEQR